MRKTVDISGFGGSYELGCQLILESGLKYLQEHPDFSFAGYNACRGVIGLLVPPDHADAFEAALGSHPVVKKNGMTGAMHHCVVGHLMMIHKKGYEHWLSEFDESRKYEFDGTINSVPQTDLSREMDSRQ